MIKLCSIDGCNKRYLAKGLCQMHYGRFTRHGDPNATLHKKTCSIEGCFDKHKSKGLCVKHYQRLKNGLSLTKRQYREMTVQERIETHFIIDSVTGCWNWLGCKDWCGYGSVKYENKGEKAHRLSYKFHKGEIPEGMFVCHQCDNPACINPDHLFLGTPLDNVRDMFNKKRDRHPFGESHTSAKLKEVDVIKIKNLLSEGYGNKEIALLYGVRRQSIYAIKIGKTWRHL